jgi:hypothetical protein
MDLDTTLQRAHSCPFLACMCSYLVSHSVNYTIFSVPCNKSLSNKNVNFVLPSSTGSMDCAAAEVLTTKPITSLCTVSAATCFHICVSGDTCRLRYSSEMAKTPVATLRGLFHLQHAHVPLDCALRQPSGLCGWSRGVVWRRSKVAVPPCSSWRATSSVVAALVIRRLVWH